MMIHSFHPPAPHSGFRALASVFGYRLPAVGFGEQQRNDAGSCHAANSAGQYGDKLSEYSHSEQADSNDVSSWFGINIKPGGHQDRMTNLIEKR